MENFQSNQMDNLKGAAYIIEKSNKKAWLVPVIVEISKFSILNSTLALIKDEGPFPSNTPS